MQCENPLLLLCLLVPVLFSSTVCGGEIQVSPGESIQDAVDSAVEGDTLLIAPGTYSANQTAEYGLLITKNNITLIGETSGDEVILLQYVPGSTQKVGLLAAPTGCDWDTPGGENGCIPGQPITNIRISGITVQGFPEHGIQTRCVDDFEIENCRSVDNLGNGLYPTLSTNGMVKGSVSQGSRDAGLWPSGCENVTVLENEVFDCVLGFEITVSNRIWARDNRFYDNTVGIGLFHANESSNPARPIMKDWFIENNDVYGNNRPNDAPPTSAQAAQPPGFGVFLMGVSDHIVRNNRIHDNGSGGFIMIGYCTAQELQEPGSSCDNLKAGPSANNNLISNNKFWNNGKERAEIVKENSIPGVDILYLQSPELGEDGSGNCFEYKFGTKIFSVVDGEPAGLLGQQLPNGCDYDFFTYLWISIANILNKLVTLPQVVWALLFGG